MAPSESGHPPNDTDQVLLHLLKPHKLQVPVISPPPATLVLGSCLLCKNSGKPFDCNYYLQVVPIVSPSDLSLSEQFLMLLESSLEVEGIMEVQHVVVVRHTDISGVPAHINHYRLTNIILYSIPDD